jgi:hypothetical protein
MHQFATGTTGHGGLPGGEPPLSPETIGRAPSNFDAPVPVIPLEELVRLKAQASGRSEPAALAAPVAMLPTVGPLAERRRIVVRLVGGDEVELAVVDGQDAAVERARTIAAELGASEQGGCWPELAGRHVRPASILSVDVLPAA